MNPNLPRLRKKAMELPLTPGVYIMRDKSGKIIYVGKAKALKNRVSQYFGSQNTHGIKVRRMVEQVEDFDYILTDSEFEALVLECSLIKQNQPKYNILLKDDKGYHYIRITKGPWPKIRECKQMLDDGADYIGPYTSSYAVRQAVDETLKIFKLPQCSKVFPRDYRKSRPCLNGFIGQCAAPCAGRITQDDYLASVKAALSFLRGGSQKAMKEMQEQMEQAAEELDFEKAARLRDRIAALKKVNEKQKVVSNAVPNQDVFALVQGAEHACFEVLRFENGRLYDSEFFLLDPVENLPASRAELITRYYSMQRKIPVRITVDGEVEEPELICQWLTEKAGKTVRIAIPQKGEQAQLVQMCRTNASQRLAQKIGRTGKEAAALAELGQLLGLPKPPGYIEAYDISHTAGSDNVAGMVVFKDGRPFKQAYKKFGIKGFQGQDDYGSMREVLTRRFTHYMEEKDSGEGFGRLPDLILLDGGQGQVNAVLPVIQEFQLQVPVFGMVKDDKHRTRAIAADGGEIAINSKRQAFTLVAVIQEEVHRFSVAYHHKKHSKASFTSSLLEIEGVGATRAKTLLQHFKTIKAIRSATVEELSAVKGIPRPCAQKVYDHYHGGDGDEI